MLVFVDYEHADYAGEWAQHNQAARTRITYRLEDVSGLHCHLVRYDRIDRDLLARLDASAIFISGQATDPDHYRAEELANLQEIVRSGDLPVFGFCGGWQFVAQALGLDLVPIEPTPEQSADESIVEWPGGVPAEFGYHPVELDGEHPLLDGLGPAPVFRHAHGLHIPVAPSGFRVLASTGPTPIQLAVDDDRRLVGTQFHPEYWTDEHPAGRRLIANFLVWAGVLDAADRPAEQTI
jgi:GMP synthase (glutamine-hydrolysing)